MRSPRGHVRGSMPFTEATQDSGHKVEYDTTVLPLCCPVSSLASGPTLTCSTPTCGSTSTGFPWWLSDKKICLQCRRPRFDPLVGKIPWRRAWQPTPVCLPREFHGQRNLGAAVQGVTKSLTCLSDSAAAHQPLRMLSWHFLGLSPHSPLGPLTPGMQVWICGETFNIARRAPCRSLGSTL